MCGGRGRALRFVMPVLGHMLKHVPGHMLRHVPGHMLEHVPKHVPDRHVLDRHVPEHVLAWQVIGHVLGLKKKKSREKIVSIF